MLAGRSYRRHLRFELLGRHGEALIERAARLIESASYAELFRLNAEGFYEFVEADPYVWRMLFRDPPSDPEVAEAHRRFQARATEAIASVVASVRPGEELLPGVPRTQANAMLAEGIKSAINGLAGWWSSGPTGHWARLRSRALSALMSVPG